MSLFEKILKFTLVAIFLFVYVEIAEGIQAQNLLEVKFSSQPLFEAQNVVPGFSTTSWVKVYNKTNQRQKVGVAASRTSTSSLAPALEFIISESSTDLYGGSRDAKTLADFFAQSPGGIYLSDLEPYASTTYNLTLTFNKAAGNKYQGSQAGFDFDIGFFPITKVSEEKPAGAGGAVIIPAQPEQEITITNIQPQTISSESATIKWDSSLTTKGAVVYGTSSVASQNLAEPPNYGYPWRIDDTNKSTTHSVMLTGLEPGTTYYYRIVAWASPEEVSAENSFKTLAVTTAPSEEEAGTPPAEEGAPPGEGIGGPGVPPAEETSFAEATEGEKKPAPAEGTEEEEITAEEITKATECLDAGYYWYDEGCHDEPEAEKLACKDITGETECTETDCFWYDDSCHEEPEAIAKGGFFANLGANILKFLAGIPWWVFAIIIAILAYLYWFFVGKREGEE